MKEWLRLLRNEDAGGEGGAGGEGDKGKEGDQGAGGEGDAAAAAAKAASDKAAADAAAAAGGDWRNNLPAEYKDHPSLKNFKTPADLAKSHLEALKLVGREKIPVPTDKSTAEEWKAFYSKVGLPETPDKYVMPDVKLPEGVTVNEELMTGFKKMAHDAGLSNKQLQAVYSWYGQQVASQHAETQRVGKELMAESDKALRTEYGAKYEQNKTLAGKVINQFGTPELIAELDKVGGLGNNPHLFKMLVTVASKFGEGQLIGKNDGQFSFTPEEARKKMNAMLGDPKHPYNVADHPEHSAALDEYLSLAQMANAGTK